jgi:D-threo-aldose 1-dehydrogenase
MTLATRPLGRTGLLVTELGFGAAGLGNLYAPVDDATARATVDAALAAGIGYVDTAPFYGFGLSERRVGDAIRHSGALVSTKVGRLLAPDPGVQDDRERDGFRSAMPFAPVFAYDHASIMRSWEASVQRLGVARIDILYVHDIGRLTHGDDHDRTFGQLVAGGGLRALEELRDGGAIGGFGIGVNEVDICLDVIAETRLDAILLAGRYTLLEQGALDRLMPACAAAGTSIVIGGPYNSGILATGTKGPTPYYDYAPAPAAVIARVAAIEAVAARHDVPLAAAALQFPLAHPVVASVIPGLADPARVAETMRLYQTAIPRDFWAALKAEGLLRPDAPVPAA